MLHHTALPHLVQCHVFPDTLLTFRRPSRRTEIRELSDAPERREALPILRQLWTDADPDEVLAWIGEERYHLFGGFRSGELVGVTGVLVASHLHHVRHAWLYDLVVDEPRRGEGVGTALVEFVERWATEQDCETVSLASPLSKEAVFEFYADRGYERWGYVVEREL
jgi:GNAT superfamily N-acetyltransferase